MQPINQSTQDALLKPLEDASASYVLVRFDKQLALQINHSFKNPALKAAIATHLRLAAQAIEESIYAKVNQQFQTQAIPDSKIVQLDSSPARPYCAALVAS